MNTELKEHRTTEMVDAIFDAIPRTPEGDRAMIIFHKMFMDSVSEEYRIPMIIAFTLGLCALLPVKEAAALNAKTEKWMEEIS